jgi:gamma-glutamyltranspeptidase
MGDVQAIAIDTATGVRRGASDPRYDGVTLGY